MERGAGARHNLGRSDGSSQRAGIGGVCRWSGFWRFHRGPALPLARAPIVGARKDLLGALSTTRHRGGVTRNAADERRYGAVAAVVLLFFVAGGVAALRS